MFRRPKKRRVVGFALLVIGCIYIFQSEVEKSWNRRRKTVSIAEDSIDKPFAISFDFESYIARGRKADDGDDYARHAFNVLVSDELPADRDLPDTRHHRCKEMVYDIRLGHSVSVIISFHNEARSTLLRTIVSVLNRTPGSLLKEIILVDDFSDDARDGSELVYLPKVQVIRNSRREGVSRSRMAGVRQANGSYVMFLDSHCEVNAGWLPPLLHVLNQYPKALVSPVIDIIDTDTFQYTSVSGELKGGFDWNLNYRWLPDSKKNSGKNTSPQHFKTPVIPGGLFLVNRTWFLEMGGLDTEMDVWGAENIEVSIKAWLCGGRVLAVPCSRVGHVFRKRHPYDFPPNGSLSTYLKNSRRIAENWLDDYKYQYYDVKPEAKKQELGSVEEIKKLKLRLQCNPFQWYLDNVFPELKPLSKDALALGRLQQEDLCLEAVTKQQNKTTVALSVCSETKKEQEWFFSKSGHLHQDQHCLTANVAFKKQKVYLAKCSNDIKQKWTRRRRFLVFQGLCLENTLDLVKGRSYLMLNPCRREAYSQRWDFDVELQTWGDR